jgi:hypothetical protein
MFFYSETSAPSDHKVDVWKMNGTKAYLRHYDNYLFLQFVTNNPRASQIEKRQARTEMTICEKKLAFWQRHPNYDHDEALKGVDLLNKQWQQGEKAA